MSDSTSAVRAAPRPWEIAPFAVVDGGLSTALEELGHRPDGLLWTAQLVVDRPEVVVAAHRSFVEAGADIVITSSYQASEHGFVAAGCSPSEARRALASTTSLARAAGADVVACSIGPFGATLGDGSEYHGEYDASWDEVRRFHRARLEVLADTGPDLFAIETIPGRAEAEIVLDELARCSDLSAWLSLSCVDAEHTCAGDRFADVAAVAAAALAPGQLIAVGVNCTDPRFVAPLLQRARSTLDARTPFVVYPNHGRDWDAERKCWIGDGVGADLDRVRSWVTAGATMVGGCCGVGSDGIRAIVAMRAALASEA